MARKWLNGAAINAVFNLSSGGWLISDVAIPFSSSLEGFQAKWNLQQAALLRQSISLSVASKVRRDAQAVIPAISTACAASAR